MDDPETRSEWARKEPQKTILECLEQLQDRGFTADELSESLLALHLVMAKEMYGPWPVANRLTALATRFAHEADEADQIRRASAEDPDGQTN
jgi:hypothetical protein